ncbi:MAG: phosphoglycolate phosphatase [Rhodospirillaceae bacterium]|nr:phosphoglycolate phosphatase [Rhodospirillales bacterium]
MRGVVLDLDGTLIDSVPDVAHALNCLLAEEGRRLLTMDEVKGLVGEGVTVLMEGAYAATGATVAGAELSAAIARYQDFYARDPATHTIVFPQVRETLERLAAEGVALGICTNKPYRITGLVLEALGLAPLFRAVTGGDNLPFRKPDGRHILATVEMMGLTPDSVLYVGDSITDVRAARDAKIPVVAVAWGYADEGGAEALGADAVIDDFSAIPDLLRRLVP